MARGRAPDLHEALEAARDELRDLRRQRADAQAVVDGIDEQIADVAIRVKGPIPVNEITKLLGLKSRASIYNLIAWRNGERPNRH